MTPGGPTLLACALLAIAPSAHAEEAAAARAATAGGPTKPSDAPVPSCIERTLVDELGQELKPRGVQQRDFEKRGQLAITGRGGLMAGDLMSSSYAYGGAVAWFPTEDLGLELGFDVSPIRFELEDPLAEFFGDQRIGKGRGYLVTAGLLWAPIHAKLKLGDSIVHADLMLAGGAGRLIHDTVQGIAFEGGPVLELFFSQWVTFRVDLRDVLVVQEALSETRLANNVMLTGGVSLWLPTGW